jgi:tetratricopeptide (TPR) repeat protein
VLGIPHSPGFPLYVIWGAFFTLIPVSNSALLSNSMSALWGSLALVLLYLVIIQILSHIKSSQSLFKVIALSSALFLAFSTSFWLQAIRAEVYTLNIFFTLLLTFLLIRWQQIKELNLSFKILILFSFVLGLSLTNHPLLIITLLPGFLFLFFCGNFRSFLKPERLFILSLFLMLGISVYLYLPIRSSLSPAINWGKPDSWSNLISYLFRTSQTTAPSSGLAFPYLNRFGFNLSFPVDQFGLAFFWLGVVGAISLLKSHRRIFLFTFLIFILNLLTATWAVDFSLRNYDLLGYLLPSLSVFAIWFASGLKTVWDWMFKQARIIQSHPISETGKVLSYMTAYVVLGLLLTLPLFQIWRNFDLCNKRGQIGAYSYAQQILTSVKKNALILVGDDNTLTSLWYLNLSRGIRPDVKILSISALTQKGYREQLSQKYEKIILPEIEQKDLGEIACRISQLNAGDFSIYSTPISNHPLFIQHFHPAGYVFEFHPKKAVLSDNDIIEQKDFLERHLRQKDLDIISREHFGNLLFNLGTFYDRKVGVSLSIDYFLWALDMDPSNARIYFQLGKAFLKNGYKAKASEFLQAGLELDPYNLEAKKLLERT